MVGTREVTVRRDRTESASPDSKLGGGGKDEQHIPPFKSGCPRSCLRLHAGRAAGVDGSVHTPH